MRSMSLIATALAFGSALACAQTPAPANPKAPHGAKVFIESPKDGATVGADVTIKFGASGVAIKPAGDTTPDSGHHHLLIDAKELPAMSAPIPNDATHKHYGKGQIEDTIHLAPGTHTLQLDFGDTAHRQFDPPIVSEKITITVK